MNDAELQALEFAALPEAPEAIPALALEERFRQNVERYEHLTGFGHASDLKERISFQALPDVASPPPAAPPPPPQASSPAAPAPSRPSPTEHGAAHALPAWEPLPDAGPHQESFGDTEPSGANPGASSAMPAASMGQDRELVEVMRQLIAEITRLRESMTRDRPGEGDQPRKPGPQPDGSFVPGGFGQMRGGTERPRPGGAYPSSREQVGPSEWARVIERQRAG